MTHNGVLTSIGATQGHQISHEANHYHCSESWPGHNVSQFKFLVVVSLKYGHDAQKWQHVQLSPRKFQKRTLQRQVNLERNWGSTRQDAYKQKYHANERKSLGGSLLDHFKYSSLLVARSSPAFVVISEFFVISHIVFQLGILLNWSRESFRCVYVNNTIERGEELLIMFIRLRIVHFRHVGHELWVFVKRILFWGEWSSLQIDAAVVFAVNWPQWHILVFKWFLIHFSVTS